MPILFVDSENWIVSGDILEQLESFLGELAKRALKWPRHFSNTAAMTVLDLESVTSKIVVRQLALLKRQLPVGAVGVAAMAMRSLLDNLNPLCLVGECRELEKHFGTNYTDAILKGGDEVSMQDVKRVVKQADRVSKLEKCRERAPLIVGVVDKGGSWARLSALHLGTRHKDGLMALSGMLAHHGHGSKPCPLCDENNPAPNHIGHLLRVHQHEIGLDRTPLDSVDQLLIKIADCNIQFLYKCRKLFLPF